MPGEDDACGGPFGVPDARGAVGAPRTKELPSRLNATPLTRLLCPTRIFSTAGRARPDPARPRRAVVPDGAAARRGRPGQPAARHAGRAPQRAQPRRSARRRRGPRGAWSRTHPPSARSRRWCCSRCRASGCCCSCGWRSAARAAEAEGLPLPASFSEAAQLALEADVRISGVPVGKVKTIEPDKAPAARTSRSSSARVRAAAVRRPRDPAPEDAAGRDLRRADARAQLGAKPIPEGGRCRPRRSPTRSSSTRSCAPSTPRRGPRSRTGCRRRRRRSRAAARPQRRARQPGAVRGGHGDDRDDPQQAGGRRVAPDRQHGDRLRRAVRARRPAALADRELQLGLRDDRGARHRAAGRVPGAADVREGVEADVRAPGRVRRARPTR